LSEGFSGPDYESSDVSTWSKLQKVKSVDVESVNTWKIFGSSLDKVVLISMDDEWALSHNVSGVSHLAMSLSDSS